MLYCAAVAISIPVIEKEASPSISITILSGRATLTPMAAGSPKPIVPRPPDVRNVLGYLQRKCCAAHIWCCPTPVVMSTSSLRWASCLSSSAMTAWGFRIPTLSPLLSTGISTENGCLFFHPLMVSIHSALWLAVRVSRCGSSASQLFSTSPSRATSAFTTLLMFLGRISMWMMPPLPSLPAAFASRANVLKFPVTRSSNLDPRAMMQSACWTARLA
mmetsp:Transcript_38010/g.74757  ORF Transcript_38010/g.74757 Transcript_38010/m.74757 type:complete len:217 (-) Transcript_38010:1079-1729(-)